MQKHCPYCQFGNKDYGKDFLVQIGNKEEQMCLSKYKDESNKTHFYISIVTNDTADSSNGIQERSSHTLLHTVLCAAAHAHKNVHTNESDLKQ